MPQDQEQCEEIIYSNDYADYVIEYAGDVNGLRDIYNPDCIQILDRRFAVIHQRITGNPMISLNQNRQNCIFRACKPSKIKGLRAFTIGSGKRLVSEYHKK